MRLIHLILSIGVITAFTLGITQKEEVQADETYPTELVKAEATAYCHGTTTADGSEVRPGICAAKPEWIGLTALIYEDLDGQAGELIGIYEIKDTGGDYRIQDGTCFDIYMREYEECIEFGRQKVLVQLIDAKG